MESGSLHSVLFSTEIGRHLRQSPPDVDQSLNLIEPRASRRLTRSLAQGAIHRVCLLEMPFLGCTILSPCRNAFY